MPQEAAPKSVAADVRQLFADVLKDDEKLKIRSGQAVVLNDSDFGKPRDRLKPETFFNLRETALLDSGDRVEIPLTAKGNVKAPEIEVVGVSGPGQDGERLLFRQEKNLGISVNEVGDLIKQQANAKDEPVQDIESEPTQDVAAQAQTTNEAAEQEPSALEEEEAADTLTQKVDQLPQSNTKALWRRISADFRALNQQFKDVAQKNKEIIGAVAEAPSAIKQDAAVLAGQAKQQLSDIGQAVQTKVAQTSLDDVKSMAISGAGAVAEAGSKGLGKVNLYLKNRAEQVKSYGMAKAALRLYAKGHARTGESTFSAKGYTVEAVTNGFTLKNAQNKPIMSFATDEKGKPISVTKEKAIQPADYKQINQASKQPVIQGSPAAEAQYAARVSAIVEGLKGVVAINETITGDNFYITRDEQTISLTTQGMPRRELTADLTSDTISSTLTQRDLEQVESNIEKSLSLPNVEIAIKAPADKKPQVEMMA